MNVSEDTKIGYFFNYSINDSRVVCGDNKKVVVTLRMQKNHHLKFI